MTCELPINEEARLQALRRYGIPEPGAADDFTSLTRLAATVCRTPIAVVSLVGADSCSILSGTGLNALQYSQPMSFCSLVALHGRSMVVEDAWGDSINKRLAEAYDPPIRFYAGSPLTTPDGYNIGALGVMDTNPRRAPEDLGGTLAGLAEQAVTHLELRRHARVLADTVQELRAAEQTILHLAHHDALTDLPGRILFHDRLEHALHHAVRYNETLAVMFLDLDGFKAVNDTHGHAAGDRLLQEVAWGLRSTLRRSDTVARMGGDEFAIVCPDLRDPDNASLIAQKLLACVRSCHAGDDLTISASIGVSIYPYDGATAETLLCDADTAMYRAKRRGKDTFAFSAIAGRKG